MSRNTQFRRRKMAQMAASGQSKTEICKMLGIKTGTFERWMISKEFNEELDALSSNNIRLMEIKLMSDTSKLLERMYVEPPHIKSVQSYIDSLKNNDNQPKSAQKPGTERTTDKPFIIYNGYKIDRSQLPESIRTHSESEIVKTLTHMEKKHEPAKKASAESDDKNESKDEDMAAPREAFERSVVTPTGIEPVPPP